MLMRVLLSNLAMPSLALQAQKQTDEIDVLKDQGFLVRSTETMWTWSDGAVTCESACTHVCPSATCNPERPCSIESVQSFQGLGSKVDLSGCQSFDTSGDSFGPYLRDNGVCYFSSTCNYDGCTKTIDTGSKMLCACEVDMSVCKDEAPTPTPPTMTVGSTETMWTWSDGPVTCESACTHVCPSATCKPERACNINSVQKFQGLGSKVDLSGCQSFDASGNSFGPYLRDNGVCYFSSTCDFKGCTKTIDPGSKMLCACVCKDEAPTSPTITVASGCVCPEGEEILDKESCKAAAADLNIEYKEMKEGNSWPNHAKGCVQRQGPRDFSIWFNPHPTGGCSKWANQVCNSAR